jgi:hypothetical protein
MAMSKREVVLLTSRTLALLMTVWALTEVSWLPSTLYSFLHYGNQETVPSPAAIYWRHHYLIELGFRITRIVGYSLTSVWLVKSGAELEELLLPEGQTKAAEE